MSTTQVNVRLDSKLKEEADKLFTELGMNMTTAINIFISQSVREKRIPFEVKIDPFYSEENMKVLLKSIQQANEGKVIAQDIIED